MSRKNDYEDEFFDDLDVPNLTAVPIPSETPAKTMSVQTMGRMLGLHKTDSYWLVHKNFFDTVLVNGQIRIDIESFEEWYSRQIKYKKVNGAPPGEQLREESYDAKDISRMLGISETVVYDLMKKENLPYVLVDYWKRWPKEEFDRWYSGQSHYRIQADREADSEDLERSMFMPEMAWLLGISRSVVYSILSEARVKNHFEFVFVADKKRVTKESFMAWYENQNRYRMVFATIEEAQADKARALKEQSKRNSKETEDNLTDKEILRRFPSKKSGNPEYYSAEEVAKILGRTPGYVKKKIREGFIPGKLVARCYRINRLEFDRWLIERDENTEEKEE